MRRRLSLAFFGSSLVSAYWNGAATYYRGIIRAVAERGHSVTFYEPDAFDRQKHRDIADPDWAKVVVYDPLDESAVSQALDQARRSDVVVKASGVGVLDEYLEATIASLARPGLTTIFWDVDAPATLQRIAEDATDPFRSLIPSYDLILTYGGGDPVVGAYRSFGARRCIPIYNALDPTTHFPTPPEPRFAADLALLANRLPDREGRIEEFFLKPARRLPSRRFLLGGNGWRDKGLPGNVDYLGHVYTKDHNALNSTPSAVLNVSRDSMAATGFSPATRVFEAAGAGACLISDAWTGIEQFLEPGREILVAKDGDEVAALLDGLTPTLAAKIGAAARRRVLADHTYDARVEGLERILEGGAA
jgi:spore maturation protein CgeB